MNAPEAQAQINLGALTGLFGSSGLAGLGGNVLGFADPFLQGIGAIGGAIPFVNIFIANGANGTNATINPTTGAVTQATAGGNAGILCCNGGAGGNGANGVNNGVVQVQATAPAAAAAAASAASSTRIPRRTARLGSGRTAWASRTAVPGSRALGNPAARAATSAVTVATAAAALWW
jgi:hypothetical protein